MKLVHNPGQLIAFVTFAAVVAGTPGPSNALLTAIGARVGILKGLASLLGQVTGMGAMLFASSLSCSPWSPCHAACPGWRSALCCSISS